MPTDHVGSPAQLGSIAHVAESGDTLILIQTVTLEIEIRADAETEVESKMSDVRAGDGAGDKRASTAPLWGTRGTLGESAAVNSDGEIDFLEPGCVAAAPADVQIEGVGCGADSEHDSEG